MMVTTLESAIQSRLMFSLMGEQLFIPTAIIAEYYDTEYFYMRSGRKVASPLVLRVLYDNDGFYQPSEEHTLANLVLSRYKSKWEMLYLHYTRGAGLSFINNISINESTSGDLTSNSTKSTTLSREITEVETPNTIKSELTTGGYTDTNTKSESDSNIRSGSLSSRESGSTSNTLNKTGTETKVNTHTGTITDAGNNGGTKTITTIHRGTVTDAGTQGGTDTVTLAHTGTINDSATTNALNSVFPYNASDNNGHPASNNAASENNTKTFNNNDTTTETRSLTDGNTKTYNNDDTVTDVSNLTDSNTKTFNNTDSETLTPNLTEASVLAHGKVITDSYDNLTDERSVQGSATNGRLYNNLARSISNTGTISKSGTVSDTGGTTQSARENKIGSKIISGIDYRRTDLVKSYISLFVESPFIDFLKIVFEDTDEILTLPVFI